MLNCTAWDVNQILNWMVNVKNNFNRGSFNQIPLQRYFSEIAFCILLNTDVSRPLLNYIEFRKTIK